MEGITVTDADTEGREGFFGEGYEIICDASGVRIEVTEYHVEPLVITWERLLEMKRLFAEECD